MAGVKFKERTVTKYLVVHCAATKPSMDIGLREIRQWHRQRGWLDIGYHFVIRRDGTVETGRPVNTIGAHVEGHNYESVGVCLVGGINTTGAPENNFTDSQFKTLRELLDKLKVDYPSAKIVGHRDLDPNKACPSFDVASWL
ncbi:N-acetylmuramoyl-L-alanine amidase [Pseudomonas phage vB_PsyP_3MF5]|uniref:amidase n=1 Tax=Pseudomonas phage vB_PsyP_3MF5 TaxID=2749426 RepID=UPI001BD9F159|nr:amidase [Pseudomonas phage vB_PsyP_3MF5]QLI47572.1 N-acetylmuramoyl-L-alanine amidase [Pseudomonas phage vB_PsyP_3MF5]